MLERCKGELEAEGLPYDRDIALGIMVLPPAALIADLLAQESNCFLSTLTT